MNLRHGKSAQEQGVPESLQDSHIFPTPLYMLTSFPIELISSMVNWRIRLSRSLAAVCCRETFRDRWDWIAVCWIWTRIFRFVVSLKDWKEESGVRVHLSQRVIG